MNFQKLIFYMLVSFAFSCTCMAQQSALAKFKIVKDSKIQLGMTPQEIRAIFGAPKAIESGFPDAESGFISDAPKLVGQLNSSSWMYTFDLITVDVATVAGYYVNGQEVDQNDYEAYEDESLVYMREGKVIGPGMAKGYKVTKDKKLTSVPKNRATTKIEQGEISKVPVLPVYFVIFDKGTQSVASTRAYFIK